MSNAPKRVGIYTRPEKGNNRSQLIRIAIAVVLLVIALLYYFLHR